MCYIGIDLGGTNIAGGIVDENGKMLYKLSVPTDISGGYQKIVKDIFELSQKLLEDAEMSRESIKGIGIGTPGTVDCEKKIVIRSGNLNIENAPIAEEFQKYWDIPVEIENDAGAAAYGEYIANGDKSKVFIAITLGTGIGGGIVINGELFRGGSGKGTEPGHITMVRDGINCACGRKGCWERYASATALAYQIEEAMKNSQDTLMYKIAEKKGKIDATVAFEAADSGDAAAKEVISNYISYLTDGLLNLIYIFRPDKIVIGGGISNRGEKLLDPVLELLCKNKFYMRDKFTKVEIAKLKNDAGIIGAAMLASKK